MTKQKAYSILIRKVPDANNIRMNNLHTVCYNSSSKVLTGPEATPISYAGK